MATAARLTKSKCSSCVRTATSPGLATPRQPTPPRCSARPPAAPGWPLNYPLQRLDLYLAEFDDAAFVGRALAVLKRNAALGEFVRLRPVDRLLAVEHHRERVALGGDLVDVPFVGGMRH